VQSQSLGYMARASRVTFGHSHQIGEVWLELAVQMVEW
jgi:hypothetical protein